MSRARSPGQPGNIRRISRANASANRRSSASRRRASRARRRRRTSASARHRSSARASAASSTSTPCRSYRLLRRLNRTTTADSALLPRPPRQHGVAPRQEHQMPEIRAVQAPRRPFLQHQQRERPGPALGTLPLLERLDHEKSGAVRGSCDRCHTRFLPSSDPGSTLSASHPQAATGFGQPGCPPRRRSRLECHAPRPSPRLRDRILIAASWALCDSKRSPGNGSATFSPSGCST